MRLVKARPWRHIFNFGLTDLVRDNSGGIALTGSTLAACHRTDGLSSPDWHRAKGSEPQAQPPDRHSPPQSSRSGQASHQEEMGISISGAGVGRIEGRVSDCSVAVISMGRRNTYFS